MNGVLEVDTILRHVRQAARQLCFSADAAITQQILLFGDAYYGYRFTTGDFTAIWSAADKTLKMHDNNGRELEVFSKTVDTNESATLSIETLPLQRRAA